MGRQYGALSGVAILLIVLNHAVHFTLQVSPVDGTPLRVLIVLQALGTFAVPAFLFISGAFLAYAASAFSLALIRAHLARLLWPYLIWSAVFHVLLFALGGVRYPLSGYVKNVLVGYPYHFVPLLVFWYLAAPLAVRIAHRRPVALLAAIGLYQLWLMMVRTPATFGMGTSLPGWASWTTPPVLFGSMADWAIYFPLGLVLSGHAAAVWPRLARFRGLFAAAAGLLFVLGILNAFQVVAAPWARLFAPVPLMFLLPLLDRRWIPYSRALEQLGRRSYALYLGHFVFINLAVFVVGPAVSARDGILPFLMLPLLIGVALGGPLLLMDLVARAGAARPVYRYIFGTVPPQAPGRTVRNYVSSGATG